MFPESELLPISALQHLLFCERQAALIHIERVWVENRFTVEGRQLHDKAHGKDAGPRGGGLDDTRRSADGALVRTTRGLALRSLTLGLFGVADVVEFHSPSVDAAGPTSPANNAIAARSPATRHSSPVPFPVEYKRGKPKAHDADRVQLCAQALCLEEMLGTAVPRGALFYGRTRRRELVDIDAELRRTTIDAARRLHELIRSGKTPVARKEPKCRHCSLFDLCMPQAIGVRRSVAQYMHRAMADANGHV